MSMIFLWTFITTLTKVPRGNQNLWVCTSVSCCRKVNFPLYILREFSDFCDVTYRKIVHHISVRWLSLQGAVDRTLKQYPALCSMFLSKGVHALLF